MLDPEKQRQSLWLSTARQGIAQQCPKRGELPDDLIEQGGTSYPNRIARQTRLAGIRAQMGHKRKPGSYGGRPSVVVGNTLGRQFDVAAPDTAWVSNITYIKTDEGSFT